MTDARTTTKKVALDRVGINVLVPANLHKRFRMKALSEGLTMSEAVVAAIRAWLR